MRRSDLLLVPIFFLLAVLFLFPVTLGGRTLIPADNLFAFPPWQSFAAQFNASVPHNDLLSDLLLENYAWKKFIVESIRQGQVPLWNPYLFTGVPFLAAGQHSALYPFSILFYIFPIEAAFGWFVALQLGIAGAAMLAFTRTLGLSRVAAIIAAFTYEFSAFFTVSIVFPMVISAACWLPLLLLCEEKLIRGAQRARALIGWVIVGALALGASILAGHVEITYYNLIVIALYAAWRLAPLLVRQRGWSEGRSHSFKTLLLLAALVVLGVSLAAVQLVPLYELVSKSFRQGAQDYNTIVGYAYPIRQLITFFVPDFFGNPSHHGYFDWFTRAWMPITHDANGNSINTIFWGVKNYVEAGSYVGILPMLLAGVAVVSYFTTSKSRPEMGNAPFALHASRFTLFFAALALLSLAFMFGTPLYAIMFYGLPGWSQLHSPFRWVFPFTLSIAVLAGIGADALASRVTDDGGHKTGEMSFSRRLSSAIFGWLPLAIGTLSLLTLVASLAAPAPFLALADWIFRGSGLAQHAFPDTRAFFSYEASHVAKFAVFLALSGIAIVLMSRTSRHSSLISHHAVIIAHRSLLIAVIILVTDLFVFGFGFYTSADPQLLTFTPPAVRFLEQDTSLFRITTLDASGEKTFNANVGMLYGLQDVRGYDSIIPKQYADWMNLIEGQGELIYNRIAPLYCPCNLDSALLDLANVKYVLTTQTIDDPKFTKVYAGEINIYENERVLPRAFIVRDAAVLRDISQLKSLDPSKLVLLEGVEPLEASSTCKQELPPGAAVTSRVANDVIVVTNVVCESWLVLGDAYSDGWQAFDSSNGALEQGTNIYRADGNFRAVHLSAGQHSIHFKYNPLSFRVGLYLSFFAVMALMLLAGYWVWGRVYREQTHERSAQRVLKNSALPMATALLNKAIDTVFAAFMLRLLGVENAGKYAFAIIVITYCDIFINFGFSTLVTREVSRDRAIANRYLSNTIVMRFVLLAALVPLLVLFLLEYRTFAGLSDDTTLAIVLLAISLVPSALAGALSSVFYAHEQMEYPAAITVVTTLLKVTAGVIVLLAGLGFVGLSAANIFVNVVTLGLLLYLFITRFFVPRFEFDPQLGRGMLGTSYPLMINDLLQRAFNRVDVLMLQPLKGDLAVGWYTTSYKYLDGLNILPSTFTIALFPVLSRYAAGAPDALMKAYLKSLKYLVMLSLPLMVLSFVYADFIIEVFGGSAYLPESAVALRLIIGFLPLSFINNVTHYVLIAVNQQRYLTKAFIVGALFNIGANLIFIPLFSYRASAVITILSELVLLIPFYIGIRRHVGRVDWLSLLWRPVLAAVTMSLVVGWLAGWLGFSGWSFLLVIPLSLLAYLLTLVVTRAFNADDREMMRLLVPKRLRDVSISVRIT